MNLDDIFEIKDKNNSVEIFPVSEDNQSQFNSYEIILSMVKKNFDKVSNLDKIKNVFMINRFLSKGYPIQAAYLDQMNLNPVAVVNFWNYVISNKYNYLPKWIYIKSKKKENKNKIGLNSFPKEVLNEWIKNNQCSSKDLEQLIKFFPGEFFSELKSLQDLMEQ